MGVAREGELGAVRGRAASLDPMAGATWNGCYLLGGTPVRLGPGDSGSKSWTLASAAKRLPNGDGTARRGARCPFRQLLHVSWLVPSCREGCLS